MLITGKIKIPTFGNRRLSHFEKMGYDISGEYIEIEAKDLNDGSSILIDAKCDYCGCEKRLSFKSYHRNILNGGKFSCSMKCGSKKAEETNIKEWGVSHPMKLKEIQDKSKKTNLERYGVEFLMQSDTFQEKSRLVNLEKYGVEHAIQSNEVKNKVKQTNLERYGVDHAMQLNEFKDKVKQNNLDKYGVENPSKLPEVREKVKQTNLEKYGVEHILQSEEIKDKIKQTNLQKYGVENPAQSEEVKNKVKQTNLERYGVDHAMQLNEFKEKVKQTNLERYGVENPSQSEEIQNKVKHTNLERYGSELYIKSDDFKEKSKFTNLQKYGVENPSQSEEVKNKVKQTNLERYGVEYVSQSDEVKEKSKQTNLERYGVENPSQSQEIKEKVKQTNLERYGVTFSMQCDEIKMRSKNSMILKYGVDNIGKNEDFRKLNFEICKNEFYINYLNNSNSLFRCDQGKDHNFEISTDNFIRRNESNLPLCTICFPIDDMKSIKEKQILSYIREISDYEIISGYRDGLEIDIFLPELNIGFEFNGLYWHSEKYRDKNFHLNKTKFFENKGIRIIHIWEDDWDLKRDIIKSQIKNWLCVNNDKIYARKCDIREIQDSKLCKKFLNENHIQGYTIFNYSIGLYLNEELVSIMTFDRMEGRNKMEEGGWNLNRFCSKLDINVIGGFSKLINFFLKNKNPKRLISYADRTWSNGDIYLKNGFKLISTSIPDYKYHINGVRKHKQNYKKSNLIKVEKLNGRTEKQIMMDRGIYRIWDCGKIKFEKTFQ